MPSTTLERVRSVGAHLSAVSDASMLIFLEDSAFEVAKLNPPEEYRERLERYLTLHFASLKDRTVIKEKLDTLEKHYADDSGDKGLLSTPYGIEYSRLVSELPGPSRKAKLNLTVL